MPRYNRDLKKTRKRKERRQALKNKRPTVAAPVVEQAAPPVVEQAAPPVVGQAAPPVVVQQLTQAEKDQAFIAQQPPEIQAEYEQHGTVYGRSPADASGAMAATPAPLMPTNPRASGLPNAQGHRAMGARWDASKSSWVYPDGRTAPVDSKPMPGRHVPTGSGGSSWVNYPYATAEEDEAAHAQKGVLRPLNRPRDPETARRSQAALDEKRALKGDYPSTFGDLWRGKPVKLAADLTSIFPSGTPKDDKVALSRIAIKIIKARRQPGRAPGTLPADPKAGLTDEEKRIWGTLSTQEEANLMRSAESQLGTFEQREGERAAASADAEQWISGHDAQMKERFRRMDAMNGIDTRGEMVIDAQGRRTYNKSGTDLQETTISGVSFHETPEEKENRRRRDYEAHRTRNALPDVSFPRGVKPDMDPRPWFQDRAPPKEAKGPPLSPWVSQADKEKNLNDRYDELWDQREERKDKKADLEIRIEEAESEARVLEKQIEDLDVPDAEVGGKLSAIQAEISSLRKELEELGVDPGAELADIEAKLAEIKAGKDRRAEIRARRMGTAPEPKPRSVLDKLLGKGEEPEPVYEKWYGPGGLIEADKKARLKVSYERKLDREKRRAAILAAKAGKKR